MRARLYILHSEKLDKFYVGITTETVDERISKHNQVVYGKYRYTATANDWELFLLIEVEDFSHAVRLERKIKAMKSAKYIRNLKNFLN